MVFRSYTGDPKLKILDFFIFHGPEIDIECPGSGQFPPDPVRCYSAGHSSLIVCVDPCLYIVGQKTVICGGMKDSFEHMLRPAAQAVGQDLIGIRSAYRMDS